METIATRKQQPAASFDAVMSYLHSIPMTPPTKKMVYLQLQQEVSNEHNRMLTERLKEIAALTEGWDGYEGMPVNKTTIRNFRKLLAACKGSELNEWSLAPNANGTLLLECPDAAISIASKEFSYYAEQQDRYMEANHCDFSLEALRKAIQDINTFLSA